MAGWLDWVYMVSLLLIGLGLITGVMTRLAAVGGIAWMAIFYLGTAIWPEHNPFLDDHFVYAIVLVGLSWRTPAATTALARSGSGSSS